MEIFKQRLSEYKKSNGEHLSSKSQELYYNNIRMIVEKHGLDWKIESLKKYLTQFEVPTRLSYINSILNYMTVMGYSEQEQTSYKKYKSELEILKEQAPVVNPKKEKHLAEWSEILEWKQKISDHNNSKKKLTYSDLMTEVILHLYTSFPRRNEIADLKYHRVSASDLQIDLNYSPEKNENMLIYNSHENEFILVFVDYKTNGTYGTQEYIIPHPIPSASHTNFAKLHSLLLNFIRMNKEREILFYQPRDQNQPLSRLNLSKLLQRSSMKWIQKSVSTDRIRKAYAGQNKEVIAQLEETAGMLSHSVSTNMKHYNVKK